MNTKLTACLLIAAFFLLNFNTILSQRTGEEIASPTSDSGRRTSAGIFNPLTVSASSGSAGNFAAAGSLLFTRASQTVEVFRGSSQTLPDYIATSDNKIATVTLTATDGLGKVPAWLSVNNKVLNGLRYTSGSEISFVFDAATLSAGTYTAIVTASAAGYANASLTFTLRVKSGMQTAVPDFKVNFQNVEAVAPSSWLRDFGQAFGLRTSARQGNGYTYGWRRRSDRWPLDLTRNGRQRNRPSDVTLSTFVYMQGDDVLNFDGTRIEGIWEAQVANGNYAVTVSAGDSRLTNSRHTLNIEGVNAISYFAPSSRTLFKSATVSVTVSDGLLTIDAAGGINTKINYVIIKPSVAERPSVTSVNPENGSINISENTSVSTNLLNLPNGGINNNTITSANVYLAEKATSTKVPANVNGTGGGDAITLVPAARLKLNTTYNFVITSGVKDLSGAAFIPYISTFTTGAGSTGEVIKAKFDKVALPNATGRHSSLTIGPDGKLYALTIDGVIKRFAINSNGTLGNPELLYALQDAYGRRQQRLAIGLAFDPSSTATNLIAWVTHSSYVFLNGPDWDGKLTKLSGANLQSVTDVLINLPRSSKDHLSNSIAFGPDRALYFNQGSNSAMGKGDETWNHREEHLLSAAVLRLDLTKLGSLPLNVKTAEGGGSYNPYASNAPLTIYASGLRNAYDLVWHSNGKLYVPTNGSAAGGNTPASVHGTRRPDGSFYNGPSVPALTNVQQTQKDYLFRVTQGGYYGHPNPLRGEYVLNGGNPTSATDPAQVGTYPAGTPPDANWRGFSFDFQNNASPNGAIEYKSNMFNGALKGKLLVVRYSQHDDIITLEPGGANNDIVRATEGTGVEGFSGFVDPLDLTEDLRNGNIYISEYGGSGRIVLLRPNTLTTAVPTTLRINSGGGALSASAGTFSADNYFTNTSNTSAYANPVDNTTDDLLYQNYRKADVAGGNFGYRIPVANATYTVKLHLAELYFTANGSRVFNVSAEGAAWLTNYDVFASAGGKNKAKVETINVTVSDGFLDLSFTSVVDRAMVCAIEVIPAASTTVTKAIARPWAVEEVSAPISILYPNPARSIVMVNVDETAGRLKAIVTNVNGTMVLQESLSVSRFGTLKMNVAALRPGVYFLTLQTGNGMRRFKFIKE